VPKGVEKHHKSKQSAKSLSKKRRRRFSISPQLQPNDYKNQLEQVVNIIKIRMSFSSGRKSEQDCEAVISKELNQISRPEYSQSSSEKFMASSLSGRSASQSPKSRVM